MSQDSVFSTTLYINVCNKKRKTKELMKKSILMLFLIILWMLGKEKRVQEYFGGYPVDVNSHCGSGTGRSPPVLWMLPNRLS
jgi:hypothetical protein